MSDEPPIPKRRWLPLLLWILLAVVALAAVGALIPMRSRPIIDKWRRINVETTQIRIALYNYKATFESYPAGDSSAVFRALRGDNPRKIVFLESGHEWVSPDGSMLDPWGTPYKIYYSGKELLIRSAGPNKRFDGSEQKQFDDYIR